MREFEITRARKSDAEALAALEAVCFPPEEAATLAGFEARLDAFGDWFFVAKTPDGEIIGMIDGMATDEASIADECLRMRRCTNRMGGCRRSSGWTCCPSGGTEALQAR